MFVKPIGWDMQNFLISKLALGTLDARDCCTMYLAEKPAVVAK
jgi:hypothetical protein